jgi:hypothetical protein
VCQTIGLRVILLDDPKWEAPRPAGKIFWNTMFGRKSELLVFLALGLEAFGIDGACQPRGGWTDGEIVEW